MKRLILCLLAIPMIASAKTPQKPKASPVPLVAPELPLPQPEAVIETSTGGVTLTAEQKAEIDDWLTGLQKQNAANKAIIVEQQQHLDSAAAEIKAGLDHTAVVVSSLTAANQQVISLQGAIDAQTKELETATDERNKALAADAKDKAEAKKQAGLAWKWRFICLGIVLLFAAYTYARLAIPGLKLILP